MNERVTLYNKVRKNLGSYWGTNEERMMNDEGPNWGLSDSYSVTTEETD